MPTTATNSAVDDSWVSGLAAFLNTQENVEALIIDPGKRRISIATLGPVDEARLRERLADTLRVLEALHGPASAGQALPAGMKVRQDGGQMVLEKGELIEIGSHQELIQKEGRYAELFNLQALGYK